ncbi:hypothetical protein ANCDUO_12220 [Ancylostoma duodenale]|uniref:VOC domain-containing protein n=1 Tax=Ancylostoma duodenale TaxID=51022 RepID=A0A0C2GKH5_9BILA|nr:hypothetical protein ANCDUO_12220 [Ancylostoma duodenale]
MIALVANHRPQKEHGVYTVFVELPNSKLELLHPLGDKSPIQGFLDKNKGGGMHHICIEVSNIAKFDAGRIISEVSIHACQFP